MIFLFFIAQETGAENKVGENKKQCRNLICLFDLFGDEQLFGDNHFVGMQLINALREQAAPIIVTTRTLKHFCYWKTHLVDVVKNFALHGLAYYLSGLAMIQLADKDWHCYAHKQANLMLLVPKKYIATHVGCQLPTVAAQMEQCGFDMSNLDKIITVSPSTVLQYIDKHKRTNDTIIDHFESMFIKRDKQLVDGLLWSIYVAGHGNIGSINRSLTAETIAQRVHELERAIESEESSAREIEEYKRSLSGWQEVADEFKKYGVIRYGQIAGLKINDFLQLISFFEHGIQTAYLHYNTCFSSGFNQALVNEELARINARFIVSAQGVNEAVTYLRGIFRPTMFTNFFSAVERFFCNAIEFAAQQKGIGKDSIKAIVSTVIDKAYMDWNQPFVRIPEVGVFKAFSVDEQVKILTNSMARAYQFAGTPIDFTDPKIETIFVYPSYIGAPLKIKGHVAIVSPAPQTLAQSKETVHIFEKIIYNDQLPSVIANFVSFNTRYEPITFVIKELHCRDYSNSGLGVGDKKPMIIKDMIIHIKGSGDYHLDVVVDVVFSLNGAFYLFTKREIKNIQSNVKDLFNLLKEAFANPATQSNFNELALEVIGNKGMQALEGKEITVPLIIEYLESKIDKSALMKKPGALKNVLLLKRLDALERAVTQEALTEQKAWLKTKKSSSLLLVRSLNRSQQEAENLQQEIAALPQEKLSTQARTDLQMRIANVQNIIKKEYDLAVSQLSWFDYATIKMPSPVETIKKVGAQAVHQTEQIVTPLFIKKWSKKR